MKKKSGCESNGQLLLLGDDDTATQDIVSEARRLLAGLLSLDTDERIEKINQIKVILHEYSPFKSEPVDCVLWVKGSGVAANDYNPNTVAPPEMELLRLSIQADGYTQPIVTWPNGGMREVVDGFHRNRVGKECADVRERVHGYLPVVTINKDRTDKTDRIAATIRHNRARGKHRVDAMSDIVVELKRRNWHDERIARELGMEQDEVLRLCQITGLADLFSDQEFSKAWDVDGEISEADFQGIDDNFDGSSDGDEVDAFRTVNTSDPDRVFHTYDKWECHKAGFYDNFKTGLTKQQAEEEYRSLLTDEATFREACQRVIKEWKHSCEHYLTNIAMNRVAWMGQAALCISKGIPAAFRGGFNLLTREQQDVADGIALEAINDWMKTRGRQSLAMDEARTDRQSTIY